MEPIHKIAARAAYVGSAACGSCHAEQAEHWEGTPHARAMDTLRKIQRHRVSGCVSCHVVGFGDRSGYDKTDSSDLLENVGCEVCHGPGSVHVARPRLPHSILRAPSPKVCAECHTPEHSEFTFGNQEDYLARIRHR